MKISVGVLTVSDRCSRKEADDKSGPALERLASEAGWEVEVRAVVADEVREIRGILKDWADEARVSLILTTGGTGAGPRDVTPEATQPLLDRLLPGLPELMRREGARTSPLAALSRGLAGIRRRTLIINLPGSPRGAAESFAAVAALVPHVLEVMEGAGHEHPVDGGGRRKSHPRG